MKRVVSILVLLSAALLCTGQKINKAEYFIDTDPGFGKAVNIPIAVAANDVSLSYSVNISALSQGFHIMIIRTRDNLGRWSSSFERVFYVYKSQGDAAAKINRAEYFIDTDPGFGSAVNIPIATPANKLELSFNVDISSRSQGFHMIVLRTRDNTGRWSPASQQVFYVFKAEPATTSNVTAIEYFLDTDPGFGKGTIYSVPTPASKVTAEFTVSLTDVTNGNHVLYLRAKDASGKWSHLYSHAFSVTTTGIGDMEAVQWFKLYPNPSSGNFIIEFSDLESSTVEFTINDMNGWQVYSNELSGENISLSVDIPPGIYMVSVKAGNRVFKQKLLISR